MVDGTLVLAAGKSTRIAPVSGGRPKPLLEIAGRAVIAWNLAWLSASGIRDVWVNLHYQADVVRTALGDGSAWGLHVQYAYEPEILGTAGAWKNLSSAWGERTLVVYGDSLVRLDLPALAATHAGRPGALATIAVFDVARHAHTGIAGGRVVLRADGQVDGFVEAGASPGPAGYVNAGVYLLERRLLERLPAGFSDFGADVFPGLARRGELYAHVIEPDGYCLGLDTPAAFAVAQDLVGSARIRLS